MARKIRPEDLSEEDLRRLMIEKRRKSRRKRLDEFRRSGRILETASMEDIEPRRQLRGIDLGSHDIVNPVDQKRQDRKQVLDRVLIFIEISAILGLVFVLFNGVSLIQRLNQEITAALVQPSFTPTPLIRAVVLPSGHTPPTDPGGTRFNEAEIPEHLRPVAQALSNVPVPPPSAEQATRIEIPRININAPVVMGDGWEQLKQGVGQHIGSVNPGQKGNLVLSAHNDIFGELFRHLDQLQSGDEIIIFTNVRSYTYVIDVETEIVEPTFVQVMDPTSKPTVTLISCYPYLVNDKRIIVRATLVDG
ncbi:MAG: class D sortase [Anaerolineae bacterium]|nr:class D sortase [Anaerolineae bacterium]